MKKERNLKIITWNLNRAAYTRKWLWEFLKEIDFDLGMFQEVYMIPYEVRKDYCVVRGEMNAILVRKNLVKTLRRKNIIEDTSTNHLLFDFGIACEAELLTSKLNLVSVYNYIGPNEKDFSEFLNVLFKYVTGKSKVVVGGDFNIDEKFSGYLKGWASLAKKMKDAFYNLGFKDVLREKMGSKNVYTFITPRNRKKYQLDYLFISQDMEVVDVNRNIEKQIFTQKRLSDHLPIIAEIKI